MKGAERWKVHSSCSVSVGIFFFFFFFCCAGSWLLRELSLVAASGDYSSCDVQASHYGGFSCCRAQVIGTQASVVVTHGLSCPVPRGIFPDQGANQCPLISL